MLLDLIMPEMDGQALLEPLRRIAPHLPVLMMSGFDQREYAGRFDSLGVCGFIQKPFHPRELITRITELLALRAP